MIFPFSFNSNPLNLTSYLTPTGTFKSNAELTKWGGVIADLDRALYVFPSKINYFYNIFEKKGMENLKECVGPRQYSVVSQANFCYNGLPALYSLGFVGKFLSF